MNEIKKQCGKCQYHKNISEFHNSKNGKFGVTHTCKICQKIYSKNYYLNNYKRIRKNQRIYQLENKDHIRKYNIEYRKNNVEKIKKYLANFMLKHPNYHRDYYLKNKGAK